MRPPRVVTMGEAIVALMRHPGQPEGYLGPFASGAPCIFASAIGRLGCDAVVGMGVGDDDFGDLMLGELTAGGVDVSAAHIDPERPTSAAFVRYLEGGSRRFIFYLDQTAALEYPADRVTGLLDGADWLHVSGSTLAFGGSMAQATLEAMSVARERGVPVSLDPNIRAEASDPDLVAHLRRQAQASQVVFASEGELEGLGLSGPELAAGGTLVCHKQGAAGACVLLDGQWVTVPAIEAELVDPDGAGDIFAAAFVAATLVGRGPVDSARLACRVAGESVQVHGPMNSSIEPLIELAGR
ncbi:MAG: sugar kinase [Nostocoides sp.]